MLNLAGRVDEGARGHVSVEGEVAPPRSPVGSGPVAETPAGPLDVNRAAARLLETLPGVGPATAAAIVVKRIGTDRSSASTTSSGFWTSAQPNLLASVTWSPRDTVRSGDPDQKSASPIEIVARPSAMPAPTQMPPANHKKWRQ